MKKRVISAILCLFVAFSAAAPGLTAAADQLTRQVPLCTKPEHQHSESCLPAEPNCGLTETGGHAHGDPCYGAELQQTCLLEETPGHGHTDTCYGPAEVSCGLTETEGHTHSEACIPDAETGLCPVAQAPAHTHADGCYTRPLICGLVECAPHTHGEGCFALPLLCTEAEIPAHAHSAACYAPTCAVEEHTHTTACYLTVCAQCEYARGHAQTCPLNVVLPLFDRLMAAATAEEMYATLMTADQAERAALTEEQIYVLVDYADCELPYDSAYDVLMEELGALLVENRAENGSTLPDAAPYATGYQTGDGYKIYYANADNAELFKENTYTSVSYNAGTDTIQLKGIAEQSDPHVEFKIATANLQAGTYPYVVLTYRANKVDTTELFELTSTHNYAEAGQSETFGTINDGKFHSAIMNPGQDTAWSGTINGFRFDYYTKTNVNDLYEIDSIAFCKTLDDANYVKWERESVLNNHGVFSAANEIAAKAMARLFRLTGHSNVVVSHTDDAVVLTAQNLCDNSHSTSGFDCNAFGDAAAFDPMINFYIPGSIADEYKYMVMTYKTPSDPESVYYDISNKYPDRIQTFEQFKNTLNVQVFPQAASGNTAQEKYSRNFQIYEKDVYYSDYVLLDDDLMPSTVSVIRIDPFAVHYATAGSQLHISSIIFCKSLDDADDKIDDELEEKYPYDYALSYDGNAPTGVVTNLPVQQFTMRTDEAERTFTASTQIPVRANYTFKGWSTSVKAADILTDGKITLIGEKNQTKTQILYAIWEENKATIQYKIVGEETGATLSLTEEKDVNVVTGTLAGSTVTANTGFKITGWYTDEACTAPVDSSFVTNQGNEAYTTVSALKPKKEADAVWKNVTYYAKVEYAVADLTIITENLAADCDYLFTITGTPYDTAISFNEMTLAIGENGSKTIKGLPVGQYTVKEVSGWSWRYNVNNDAGIEVALITSQSCTFNSYTSKSSNWLDGNSYWSSRTSNRTFQLN